MTEENIKRMWDIDQKAQLGNQITKEEKEFFNAHFDLMLDEMRENLEHWEHHSGKIKY